MYAGHGTLPRAIQIYSNAVTPLGRLVLAIAVAVTVAAVCVQAVRLSAVSRDAVVFIGIAEQHRDVVGTLANWEHDQHPLYPLCVAGMYRVLQGCGVGDPEVTRWQYAGQIVSILASVAVVVGVYWCGSLQFGRRIGATAALLWSLLPVPIAAGCDVLSDMLHLAVYMAAAVSMVLAVRTGYHRWYALAGVLSGVAYWVRPEGAAVMAVGVLWACAAGVRALVVRDMALSCRGRQCGRYVLSAMVCVVGFVLVAGPLMMSMGTITRKKNPSELVHRPVQPVQAAVAVPLVDRYSPQQWAFLGRGAAEIVRDFAKTLSVPLMVVFLVFWATWRRPRTRYGTGTMVVLLALTHLALLMVVYVMLLERMGGGVDWNLATYVAKRHMLVPGALSIPVCAWGLHRFAGWLVRVRRRLFSAGAKSAHRTAWQWALVCVGVVIAINAPRTFATVNREAAHLRRAGATVGTLAGPDDVLLTNRVRIAFYAGMLHRSTVVPDEQVPSFGDNQLPPAGVNLAAIEYRPASTSYDSATGAVAVPMPGERNTMVQVWVEPPDGGAWTMVSTITR